MRIKSVKVEGHPVLGSFFYPDFDLQTEKKDIATYFIGPNGSGKSFLFEVLVDILRSAIEVEKRDYTYELKIEHAGEELVVDGTSGKKPTYTNKEGRSQDYFLPQRILFYYSGDTKRPKQYLDDYFQRFRGRLIQGDEIEFPHFFYVGTELIPFVLLTTLVYGEQLGSNEIWNILNIENASEFQINIEPQSWYKTSFRDTIRFVEASPLFWGAMGEVASFLDKMASVAVHTETQPTEFTFPDSDDPSIYDFITLMKFDPRDFSLIRSTFPDPRMFFELLIDCQTSGIFKDISISLKKKNEGGYFNSKFLSEGEKQILLTLGFIQLMQQEQFIYFLDEPDTHLNPRWKYEFHRMLKNIVQVRPDAIELFIATHDPLLISGLDANNVVMVSRNARSIELTQAPESLMGKGIEAILTSELFGLDTTLDYETKVKMLDRRKLLAMHLRGETLSPEDQDKLTELTQELELIDGIKPLEDPLYREFVKAIPPEEFSTFYEQFLSEEEQEKRTEIAKSVLEKLSKNRKK